jgi:hypothetical protein
MSEPSEDYLWDRAGKADPEIEHLESVLKSYAIRTLELDWTRLAVYGTATSFGTQHRHRRIQLSAVCALTVVVVAGLLVRSRFEWRPGAPWKVAMLDGMPRITGGGAASKTLAVGQSLITDAESRARVHVANLGVVDVEPSSEVRLVATDSKRHHLVLQYGTISAHMWAPPFSFEVGTPSADLFDLGCAFDLHTERTGLGWVRVTSGWVQFETPIRKILIPAGAESITRPSVGPGTPYYLDSFAEFRAGITAFDTAGDDETIRKHAVETILQNARKRDAFTLLVLLTELPRSARVPVLRQLEQFVAIPPGYTEEQILEGQTDAMDAYWKRTKLGNPKNWIMNWRDVMSY